MKRLLALALLGAIQAHAATWDFEIKGLVTEMPNGYGDMPEVAGEFTATDANLDGLIDLSEVSAFSMWGLQVVPVIEYASPHGNVRSSLRSFSFAQNALSFDAFDGQETTLVTGQYWSSCCFRSNWGPDTTLTVRMHGGAADQTSPVPEPSPAALLLFSFAAAGLRRWAKAKAS